MIIMADLFKQPLNKISSPRNSIVDKFLQSKRAIKSIFTFLDGITEFSTDKFRNQYSSIEIASESSSKSIFFDKLQQLNALFSMWTTLLGIFI